MLGLNCKCKLYLWKLYWVNFIFNKYYKLFTGEGHGDVLADEKVRSISLGALKELDCIPRLANVCFRFWAGLGGAENIYLKQISK